MNTGTGLLSALGALGQLKEVKEVWFNQKVFSLDGYRLVGCRFDSCTIHIATTNFELVDCYVDNKTVFTYGPGPLKAIKLYNSRNEYVLSNLGPFAPERGPDGTISIKGV